MYEIHNGLNDDPSIKLLSMGQCPMFVFGWVHPSSTSGFSFALTVCEMRALFFVSSQYVYTFDCLPVAIHSISFTSSITFFSGLTPAASRAKV